MSHFVFAIPLQRDDLFEAPTRNQYVIENVYNLRDLKIQLQDLQISVREQGADCVINGGFDVIFSLLGEFNTGATSDMKQKGIEIVKNGLNSLVDQLAVFLQSTGSQLPEDERVEHLNKFKMLLYLTCQLVQKVENEQSIYDPVTGGKAKGNKKKSRDDDAPGNWEFDRPRIISLIYNLLQLNLNQLFEPPIIEDEVLDIIGFTLFKVCENPNIALVKCKDLRLSIIQVLGTMNKKFNYTHSCCLQFTQQLKQHEHLISVFSQATDIIVKEYGCTGMVMELVREISRVDMKDMSRDTSSTRHYSNFLFEMAEKCPQQIISCVSLLTCHLDGDTHYSMRKCVLGVFGEIVIKVLTSEEMTESDREDRDNFLDCLENHIHDVHAHVRSHVLQTWGKLCVNKCIPLARQHQLLGMVTGRLQDKSSNVRKGAVQLLTALLQGNPFAAKLQTEDLQENLLEEQEKLKKLEEAAPPPPPTQNPDNEDEGEDGEQGAVVLPTQSEEIVKQKLLIQYLTDCVKFSKIIQESLPVVAQLLGSKQATDILEAIDFFVSAFEFGLVNAMIGVRKMLALIWSQETQVRDAVVSAYKKLYVNIDASNPRSAALTVAKNLIALVRISTIGEITSLEKLIGELVASKDLGKALFTVLWEYFTGVLPDSNPESARSAITLLRMCACSEVSIITANIQVIIDHGLGDKYGEDYELAQLCCLALLKIVPSKLKQDDPDSPQKFKSDHLLFEKLEKLIVTGLSNKANRNYMPMARAALKVIYQLGEGPDILVEHYIRRITEELNANLPEMGDGKIEAFKVRRVCFLIGEVAINQLNYLDVNVFTELKRRNYLREAKAEKEKRKAAEKKQKRQSMMRATALGTPMGNAAEEEDMGVMGAEADDAEAEFIQQVTEKEILSGDSLLAKFEPLLVSICSNPVRYQDRDTRTAAAMALCKFMLMSSEFADNHLRLVFTMLEKETEPVTRANIIIALGDLSVRFPNNVEPWTPKMYARLHDQSYQVRYNTLTVLTHLIFNDMIKVKGQISDIAFCIVDKEDKISMRAKLFFSELAKKGNTLYNVMPDIVSRLSDPEVGVKEDDFRIIMKYIIGLIEKDKLLESLVEKLCHRFRATRTKRQWRDISYCLSLFPYSDKSFKKLGENFNCWGDKLHEDQVYESIQVILASVRKGTGRGVGMAGVNREGLKQALEELEAKVQEARDKGVEDHTTDRRAREARGGKKGEDEFSPDKTKKKRKKADNDDDTSDEEEENDDTAAQGKRRESTRHTRKAIVEESDSSPEKEERRSRRNDREDMEVEKTRKRIATTDEEEEEEVTENADKSRKSSRKKTLDDSEPEAGNVRKSSRRNVASSDQDESTDRQSARKSKRR